MKITLFLILLILPLLGKGQAPLVRDLPIAVATNIDRTCRDSIVALQNTITALEQYINSILDDDVIPQVVDAPTPGYDSTYVLATNQKFAIPEAVITGDVVGTWKKTYTWRSGNEVSFSLSSDFNGAFTIHDSTGVITIADATKINGKIVQQDTLIKILVRSRDDIEGYEIDTAKIWVKENSYCKFFDYGYTGTEDGARNTPYNGLLDVTITPGYGYFVKRGNTPADKVYAPTDVAATAAHPIIFGAYGTGNNPKFDGAGLSSAAAMLAFSAASTSWAYTFVYDWSVINYPTCAFRIGGGSNNIGFYNIYLEGNVRLSESGNTADIHFYSYSDTSVSGNRNFEIINLEMVDSWGPAVLSQATGITLTNIKSSTASVYSSRGYNVRLSTTHGTIKHFMFSKGIRSLQIDYSGNNAIDGVLSDALESGVFGTTVSTNPQDNLTFDNVLFRNNVYGIFNYTAGSDNWNITNCYFHKNTSDGIYLRNGINNLILTRNRFIGNTNTGITFNYGTQGTANGSVFYNIFADNVTDFLASDASNSTDMLFYHNMVKGTVNMSGTSSTIFRNNFYGTLTGTVTSSNNIQLSSITTADYFTDYANNNFKLKVTASLARDAGYTVSVTPDIIGTSVPQNSVPDIGPYEYKN